MHYRLLLLLFGMLTLVSCNDTALYNASLVLPGAPMRRNEIQVSGGVNLLPQVRPQLSERPMELGAQGMGRFAINDQVTGSFNVWRSMTSPSFEGARWGMTGSMIISFETGANTRSAIIPTFGFTYTEDFLQGEGAALWYAIWPWSNRSFSTYIAAAPFVGWPQTNTDMYGYGGIMNLGTVIHLSRVWDLTLEMGGVMQVNTFDQVTSILPLPSATLVWRINSAKDRD